MMKTICMNCFHEYDGDLGLCPFCGYSPDEQETEVCCLKPGIVVKGRYIIGRRLGIGGFGIIYKAWDTKLETVMAIKEYYPSGLVNRLPGETDVILVAKKREKEFIYGKTRFLEEARNMAKFNTHKNIVNVFEYFEENNTTYIVMEFLDGMTMSETMEKRNAPMSIDKCLMITKDICEALKSLHGEGIVHRDVSPDNIFLCSDGTIKLIDFGAARFSEGTESKLTIILKPGFAPPEQYEKVNRQGPWTDIYALGATMYYALTGVKPEESTNRIIEDDLKDPRDIDSEIPKNISNAIIRAMAMEPQFRFQNIDDFEKALFSGKTVRLPEAERKRKKRIRVAGIAAAVIILAAISGVFYKNWDAEKQAVTLPDAQIVLWYEKTGNSNIDAAKKAALKMIVGNFMKEYNNVQISVEPHVLTECQAEISGQSGKADLIESSNIDGRYLKSAEDLTELEKGMKSGQYYISQKIDDSHQYPTGIAVPVVYVNTAIVKVDNCNDIQQMLQICSKAGTSILADQSTVDSFKKIWPNGNVDKYVSKGAVKSFEAGDIGILLSDSQSYFEIQSALPGQYSVYFPKNAKGIYTYSETWSVKANNEKSKKVAERFLQYLASSNVQDYLHIQNHDGSLPINIEAMKAFTDSYNELSGIADVVK